MARTWTSSTKFARSVPIDLADRPKFDRGALDAVLTGAVEAGRVPGVVAAVTDRGGPSHAAQPVCRPGLHRCLQAIRAGGLRLDSRDPRSRGIVKSFMRCRPGCSGCAATAATGGDHVESKRLSSNGRTRDRRRLARGRHATGSGAIFAQGRHRRWRTGDHCRHPRALRVWRGDRHPA